MCVVRRDCGSKPLSGTEQYTPVPDSLCAGQVAQWLLQQKDRKYPCKHACDVAELFVICLCKPDKHLELLMAWLVADLGQGSLGVLQCDYNAG